MSTQSINDSKNNTMFYLDESNKVSSLWYRTDINARNFVTSSNHRPKWKDVIRRVTVNLDDNTTVEDIYINSRMGKRFLHRPLPYGVCNIRTYLILSHSKSKKLFNRRVCNQRYNRAIKRNLRTLDEWDDADTAKVD